MVASGNVTHNGEATEDALYDRHAVRYFVGMDLGQERAPDAKRSFLSVALSLEAFFMKKKLYFAFILAAFFGATNTSAQVTNAKRGGVCIGPFRGSDSVLLCEHVGKVTIKQIYEKGFRVVHMQDDKNTATYVTLVIEEQ